MCWLGKTTMWRGQGFDGIFKLYHKVQATRDSYRFVWAIAELVVLVSVEYPSQNRWVENDQVGVWE